MMTIISFVKLPHQNPFQAEYLSRFVGPGEQMASRSALLLARSWFLDISAENYLFSMEFPSSTTISC